MPRKEQGWITFQASEEERQLLDKLAKKLHRTKTEILRELIRGLEQNYLRSPQAIVTPKPQKKAKTPFIAINNSHKNLKLSSHNILQGIVTQVRRTEISSQLTIKVIQEVELTAIIATTSVDELDLSEGTEAYVVINSNNVVIAKEDSTVITTNNQKI
ncbi:TOBE domain-containing protein [Calothrix brevissima NIES-22]|nr:TOBE domain-containing protein [Calothrix brevissima NIES-22]